MRKRWMIVITFFIMCFGVYFTKESRNVSQLQANTSSETQIYYGPEDTFKPTGNDYFVMGGIKWYIAYTDQATGKGYVISENLGTKFNCPNAYGVNNQYLTFDNAPQCLEIAQDEFKVGTDDIMGEHFKNLNHTVDFSTFALLDIPAYMIITGNEDDVTHLSKLVSIDVLLQEHVLFWEGAPPKRLYASYKNLATPVGGSHVAAVFQVEMPPLANRIKKVDVTPSNITMKYKDGKNASSTKVAEANTEGGIGPFHFYLYDTNADGTEGTYTIPSTYFKLEQADGASMVDIKILPTKLSAGDYYFKIRVVDESLDEDVYHTPGDFSADPARTKESEVIHVQIQKEEQSAIKVYPSEADRDNQVNDTIKITVDKMEQTVTVYPYSDDAALTDTTFQYKIIQDPQGILVSVPEAGESGVFELTHNKGTAVIEIIKPGNENYLDASIQITIETTEIDDRPIITATSGTDPYRSNTKHHEDVTLTFSKGANGSSVNRPLKLKVLRGNRTPAANWYQMDGVESTIQDGNTKVITATSSPTYECYWLYYDGYLDAGVEFRVDLLKETPQIPHPEKQSLYLKQGDTINAGASLDIATANHPLDVGKTKLYAKEDETTTYPLQNLAEGSYRLHLVDEYGNTNDVLFEVIAKLYFVKPGTDTIITQDEVTFDETQPYHVEAKGASAGYTIQYRIKEGNAFVPGDRNDAFLMQATGEVEIEAYTQQPSGEVISSTTLHITVLPGSFSFAFVDADGTKLPMQQEAYLPYQVNGQNVVYERFGSFFLKTQGNPEGTSVRYALKSDSPKDVIEVVPTTGEIKILNASLPIQKDKVIVIATASDDKGNYEPSSIEIPINIDKAKQRIDFKDNPINVEQGKGAISPEIMQMDLSSAEGGVVLDDTSYVVRVSPDVDPGLVWSEDGKEIKYEYDGSESMDAILLVEKPGNRNYEKSEQKQGRLHILGKEESLLSLSTPGKIYYGDTFKIKSLYADGSSSDVSYTFECENEDALSEPIVHGNEAEFRALKASDTKIIPIHVTRSAKGEQTIKKSVNIKILPKRVTITIDPKTKCKGEQNPPLTYQDFRSQLVAWQGVSDVIQSEDIQLLVSADQTSGKGSYPITGDAASLHTAYPNYQFTFISNVLEIKEDEIENDWYHMELANDAHERYDGTWTNQTVDIVSDHPDYMYLSNDGHVWNPNKLTIQQEGNMSHDFWMKKGVVDDPIANGAITAKRSTTIKIDKTPPRIKNITAQGKQGAVKQMLKMISFGRITDDGITFTITTTDEKQGMDVSGTAQILYQIYQQNETGGFEDKAMQEGTVTTKNDSSTITIPEKTGTYKVCIVAKDVAGNESSQHCEELTIDKLNVDVDGDGNLDFNDPDGDLCADSNIKYQDDKGTWITLNGDSDNDGIPDYNIDSDGDGEADINIDTDGEGRPDLNLKMLTKENGSQEKSTLWKPTICVVQHGERYASGVDIQPELNVDINQDGVPEQDIDINGDMKPDFNITRETVDHKREVYLNMGTIHQWTPKEDYNVKNFSYDTMNIPKQEFLTNIDTDGDGRPDLNLDFMGETPGSKADGKPDLNIDTDGDWIPNINIDVSGSQDRPDGRADINIDTDKDGKPDQNIVELMKWVPDLDCSISDYLYDTMKLPGNKELQDQGVIVEKPDGTFLPHFAIKVTDVTKTLKETIQQEANASLQENQEVKAVYDVKLLENNVEIKPDGTLKIKIPLPEHVEHPVLLVKKSDGSYALIDAQIEEGYLIYESDELGTISILGDIVDQNGSGEPQQNNPQKEPKPSVQGSYHQDPSMNYVGGADTADETTLSLYIMLWICSMFSLRFLKRYHNR